MVRRTLLRAGEIRSGLRGVPLWRRRGRAITRTWTFDGFSPALAFINRVGALAEEMDHHPDIVNSWATVTLSLTTHDAGGLTDLDFALAKQIDSLADV